MPTAVGAISSSPSPGTGSGRSTSSSRSSPWNSIARIGLAEIEQPSKELLTGDDGDGTRQGLASPRDDDGRSARACARRRRPADRAGEHGPARAHLLPVGDIVAGMSYLVRRLLENTSNDSFLLSRSRGEDLDSHPRSDAQSDRRSRPGRARRWSPVNFVNEPLLELRRAPVRETWSTRSRPSTSSSRGASR